MSKTAKLDREIAAIRAEIRRTEEAKQQSLRRLAALEREYVDLALKTDGAVIDLTAGGQDDGD